jgi:hypothetical protein
MRVRKFTHVRGTAVEYGILLLLSGQACLYWRVDPVGCCQYSPYRASLDHDLAGMHTSGCVFMSRYTTRLTRLISAFSM